MFLQKGSLKVGKDRKDSGCESKGLHCVCRQKDNHIQTISLWNCVFEKSYQAVHSNPIPYFTDLPVSSTYNVFIVAESGFIIQYDTVEAPCNMLVQ